MKNLNRDLQAGHQLLSIFERSKFQLDDILDHQPVLFAVLHGHGRILRASAELVQ